MKPLSRHLWIMGLFLIFALVPNRAMADEIIGTDNWQKIQGMVPDTVLEWVKKGDTTITIVDQLKFDTSKIMALPGFAAESKNNKGRFAIQEGSIVDVNTGKSAGFISGLPFPGNLSAEDPDGFHKLCYNRYYNLHRIGSIRFVFL
ncbi:MAG: hypothetical protein HUK40_03265 [Desulfobacter sp.]|nr:hypothetical protein [Desulfobacter sp.]WDP85198.1 MAG: hypothetical protein HUN05_08665 [Desulfobacter sp.]